MEPISAVGIVIGLVGSLGSTLRALEGFASRFATEEFGDNFHDAEAPLRSSQRRLVYIRNSLRTTWMHARLDEFSVALEVIDQRVRELQVNVLDMERYRTKLVSRSQSREMLRRDIEVAKSTIVLALSMVKMIRVVQDQVHGDSLLTEDARYTIAGSRYIEGNWRADICSRSQDLMTLMDDLSADWGASYPFPVPTDPDTKAQQLFARIAAPELQGSFHDRCRSERIAGTCQWFLETDEFRSWRQRLLPTGDENILWCRGRPGSGKTMIASKVIDELRMSQVFVAYFYMSSARVHSARDVIASLLKQLCLPFNFVPSCLKNIYDRSDDKSNLPLNLDDWLEALKETSQDLPRPITIVLDGLDHINMRDQKEFTRVLQNLKETSWKCLLTSRIDQDVSRGALEGCPKFTIENDDLAHDIRKVIHSALRGDKIMHGMLGDELFRSEVIETLTSRAHGMFYWVPLQVRQILDQTHPSGIRKAVLEIPSDVHGIVKSAMKQISQQGTARAQLAKRALALLTAIVAPITAAAMCHALGMANVLDFEERPSELSEDEVPNPDTIVECCQGLVAIDPMTSIVTMAHYDMEQCMRINRDSLFSPNTKIMLAQILLAYLLLDAFSSGPCHQEDDFNRRLDEHPLLDYAAHYWGHHAREALSVQEDKYRIIEAINYFLENQSNLESSLQVYSISFKPPGGREALLRGTQQDFAFHAERLRGQSTLQVATRHGLTEIVQKCIANAPEMVSRQDNLGISSLHEAAQAGWHHLVKLLLEAGANPLLVDKDGKSPLYYAARGGYSRTKSLLTVCGVKHHPSPSSSSVSLDTHVQHNENASNQVFHLDSENSGGQQEISSRKAQLYASDLEEAFRDAAAAGDVDVVNHLLHDSVNPDSEKNCKSALILAIVGWHERVLEILLKAGANPSCKDLSPPPERIPLHQAIRHNNVKMAALLLKYGANLQARDSLDRTALFEALNNSSTDGAALLLRHGVNISATDHLGETVMHKAATNASPKHASLLINQGIALEEYNKEGLTPLHLATKYECYHVVNLLVREGVDVNATTLQGGMTPLMYTTSAGSIELCQMLIHRGAKVDAISGDQKTALMLAAAAGNAILVQVLLDYGANPQPTITASKPPLMLAADAGHAAVVHLLLKKGANPNMSKYEPRKPRGPAAETSHRRILQLLHDYGASSDVAEEG